jgi:hypothetical protein
MKNNLYLLIMVIALVFASCKKESADRTSNLNPVSYRPHMFQSWGSDVLVFDASHPDSTKCYFYQYNYSNHKFEYRNTEDANHPGIPNRYFESIYYTGWPSNVTDPVLIAPSHFDCELGPYIGFYDRNTNENYAYLYDYSTHLPFRKFKFPYWYCSVLDTSAVSIFNGIFGSSLYPGKIDACIIFREEGIILDSSVDTNIRDVDYFFDFDAGTFYSIQFNSDGVRLKNTTYVESDYISTLVTKPYGNMTVNPIDFKLADAAFSVADNNTDANAFYFLDYDAMKYVKLTRDSKPAGGINLVNSDSARFNLVTTTWQPISNLFTGWKF